MTSALAFLQVSLRAFRNIRALDFEPKSGLNVIAGDNGQGKTSLLEAFYLVATSKSFRTDRLEQVIHEGDEAAVVRGQIVEDGQAREQRAVVQPTMRSVLLDGRRVRSLVAYATRTPMVLFHPGDLELVAGGAAPRRLLLDRIALFLDLGSLSHRTRYDRAMRERQKLLLEHGTRAVGMEAFEQIAAEHGSAVSRVRRRAAEQLVTALGPVFARMASALARLEASYRPGGTESLEEFRQELERRRGEDLRRGRAGFGPQRDELDLSVFGRSARRHASQGQQRLLALALKVAELECLRGARGAHPVLLLDDVSSELDPARAGAVYGLLDESSSQVFLTTTRPEVLDALGASAGDSRLFWLENGAFRQDA